MKLFIYIYIYISIYVGDVHRVRGFGHTDSLCMVSIFDTHSQFPVVLTWVEALKSCLTLWQSCWLFASTPSAAATCASASLLWALESSPGNSEVGYSMHSFVAEYDIISLRCCRMKPQKWTIFMHTFSPIASSRQVCPYIAYCGCVQCSSPSRGLRKVMLHCQILGLLMKQFLCGGRDHCVIQGGSKWRMPSRWRVYVWPYPSKHGLPQNARWDLPSSNIGVHVWSVPTWEWAEWGPSVGLASYICR